MKLKDVNHNLYFFYDSLNKKVAPMKQTVIQPISRGHRQIDRKSGLNHKQTTNRPGEIV